MVIYQNQTYLVRTSPGKEGAMSAPEDGKARKRYYIEQLIERLDQPSLYVVEARPQLSQQLAWVKTRLQQISDLDRPLDQSELLRTIDDIGQACRDAVKDLVDPRCHLMMFIGISKWKTRANHLELLAIAQP
ncbi:MAG TPA: hypothetical protein PLN95_02925 [Candidatus Saccharibacteria bacterium]|nr:hypothetical protein [Candidatus Saccharibacteria bacterium]